jgi:hypothetical protein
LAEMGAKGYQYWVLGHVHEHAILQRDPWVVFPGNLQGRHIRETGERGAMLVTTDTSGIQTVERLLVDAVRWQRVEVDATSAATLPEVTRLVGQVSFGSFGVVAVDPMAISAQEVSRDHLQELVNFDSSLVRQRAGFGACTHRAWIPVFLLHGQRPGVARRWVSSRVVTAVDVQSTAGVSSCGNMPIARAKYNLLAILMIVNTWQFVASGTKAPKGRSHNFSEQAHRA